MIQLAGYTESEKLEIAKRYLVPRQIERNGLTSRRIAFTEPALRAIIADYTREAGVRQLEREIGTVCRKVARQVAEGTLTRKLTITEPRARELLGKRRFFSEARRRTSRPGVATGLAWTPVGGEVLFIEATRDARARPADDHRSAGRRDARVGRRPRSPTCARNAAELVPELAERLVCDPRHPHPRARRRDPEGRPERRRRDGDRARVAAVRPCRPVRRRDDRRGDADRPGAPDRRPQGEGAGGATQRDQDRDRPGAQSSRTSTRSRSTCAETIKFVFVSTDRRGARGGARSSGGPPDIAYPDV